MRVLQLIDSLEAGGAERMAVSIANTLSESIERSYLCATRQEGLLKASLKPEVSYLFLNKTAKIDSAAIMKLKRYIKQEQISIIHAHSTSFFMATLMKLLRPGLKIVWHDHYGNSDYLEARQYKMLRLCSQYFSLILSVNSVLETWAKNHLKCERVSYLSNFATADAAQVLQTELKGTPGKRILCLANLRPQKDHPTLLKAFEIVNSHHPDWSLHCVGQDFEDAYAHSVYELVSQLQLQEQVFFYGSCPDSSAIIHQADIGVLASASEGLPLALLEYGLGGLPIVATNVGDCSSVLPKTLHEFLVPANSPEPLAKQLMVLIADADKRQQIAKLVKGYVLKEFSALAVRDKLMTFYDSL
ncbi:glycosyltransferase [Subsaximicrobium wynnwilliamsii]|uniref:Glycosyltransferase n=1 Tax=Subsaximicrobium wynnwilliamsii TaxID=291179 RepID=A0A5C6ZD95_9FLAO|nr:glycosyltransferase [Subsaximicrobium wynnwilliamsii]TXD81682.1 glycosyltransferase [Subsaximicrobium wynnwilliamsii]TXD87437.1 glycosyltransferase [Subsaximicrobium wynnwilliamsii]TXE01125.1 glycosyltransferase [Subsaximicrobium wynnwilliamsii]